jgi:exopolyphosphatase / guanosine-5'-triphosphate,3'-diphosphate pyrophosphatase
MPTRSAWLPYDPPMRVAVVDIGTNSTRLLIADVQADGSLVEVERRSVVTRLGDGVDASGRLSEAAVARTIGAASGYAGEIERLGCEANLAVLTSAVRDASNGEEFSSDVKKLGLDAQILAGEQEAQLMFLGAMSGREAGGSMVVIDVGGGSTEFVLGEGRVATFHTSIQAGVVRMSERHLDSDPPAARQLDALAGDVRKAFADRLPESVRSAAKSGIAVAGTATSAASIEQELDPYDPERVNGYRLSIESVDALLRRLARLDEPARREVVGLHPDRAPTIVAGMIILKEAFSALGLKEVEVSEHDILHGGALRLAGRG